MAHNIEIRNGVASFVENGKRERAWHGLGKVSDGLLTAEEALRESHANFEVEGRPIFFMTPELKAMIESGQDIPADKLATLLRQIDKMQATVRTDYNESLGVVSENYGIVQNADAFKFIDTLTTGGLTPNTPVIDAAGVLGKGERIFITAKFPDVIKLDNKGNDIVEMNIVFTTSHDGTGAVTCMVTPVRVVCENTLNWAFQNNSGKLSLRHTSMVNNRLDLTNKENAEMAYKALKLYDVYTKNFAESLLCLRQIKVSDKQVEEILAKALLTGDSLKAYELDGINAEGVSTRGRNLINEVTNTLHTGVGQAELDAGTGLWLVNGLTSFYQNTMAWKDEQKMMQSILEGNIQGKLQKAYEGVMALA